MVLQFVCLIFVIEGVPGGNVPSGGVPGYFAVSSGCSGVFQGCSGVFRCVPGVFGCVPGLLLFLQTPVNIR